MDRFNRAATEVPYSSADSRLLEDYLESVEIIPVDAATKESIPDKMSWKQSNIGIDGPLCVTDYGRHRDNCETLGDFIEFIREQMMDTIPPQYLKFMNDEKDQVTDTLVAITKQDGYLVMPYFGE